MRRLLAGATAVLLVVVLAQPSGAGARAPDRVCGIEPGDGAFNYFQVWDTKCRTARKVSKRAGEKFCEREDCDTSPDGEFVSGRVEVRQWSCKMRLGYEYYRARCRKGDDARFVHRAGA